MRHYCTISDKEYLLCALTLHDSMLENEKEEFRLYFLCLDDYTYSFLQEKKLKNIIPFHIKDIENQDFKLKSSYYNAPSIEASESAKNKQKSAHYIQYCWSLAPYFSWYLLMNKKTDHIVYVDSDIVFYKDMKGLYSEVGEKSVGIVRHRIDYQESSGEYNVGIVYFKNDEIGKKCLSWWKNILLEPNNPYYKTHGMCGDQKYLELFEPLFGTNNVCIVDKTVGHLAPWNVTYHKYHNGKIIWEEQEQDLYYFHFAHFVPYFERNTYRTSYKNEWVWGEPAASNEFVKQKYDGYFIKMKNIKNRMGL